MDIPDEIVEIIDKYSIFGDTATVSNYRITRIVADVMMKAAESQLTYFWDRYEILCNMMHTPDSRKWWDCEVCWLMPPGYPHVAVRSEPYSPEPRYCWPYAIATFGPEAPEKPDLMHHRRHRVPIQVLNSNDREN